MIKEGYSKADIDQMEQEEYDYIVDIIMEKMKTGKGLNPLTGGL